jgi:hypothetical protein
VYVYGNACVSKDNGSGVAGRGSTGGSTVQDMVHSLLCSGGFRTVPRRVWTYHCATSLHSAKATIMQESSKFFMQKIHLLGSTFKELYFLPEKNTLNEFHLKKAFTFVPCNQLHIE